MSSSSHEIGLSDVNRDVYELMVRNRSFAALNPNDWVLLIQGLYVGVYPTLHDALLYVQGGKSYLAIQPNISQSRANNRWLVDVSERRL